MLSSAIAAGLLGLATVASALVVATGDAWPLVGTCIALPLAAFAASAVADP